ncbi:MAG: M20 family metallo-hydrolase [Candidatus Njordarchaeia archaeon]
MRDWVIKTLEKLVSLNSVNPAHGGPGEEQKANYLQSLLEEMGLSVKRYEAVDNNGIRRPSLITEIGEGQTIWIISHIDTVSPGEGWTSDPFKLYVEGDKVYGRGVNDNGIGIMASLILLKRIIEENIDINYRLKIGFVADEEAGSEYGLKFLVQKGIFKKGDRALIPDGGNKEGTMVEIAEKGLLWIKFITKGKQSHGSMPDKGDNAFLKAMRFALELYDKLHEKFNIKDEKFDPPQSTFEPTKKEKNVDSVNIIPGLDVHYWDCRVLPEYKLDDVINTIQGISSKYDTDVEILIREEASQVDPNDWIVQKTVSAIKSVLKVEPKLMGIGGGTFAGILRKIGVPSVVWHIGSETEHQPNEWELLSNYEKNAEVFLKILTS